MNNKNTIENKFWNPDGYPKIHLDSNSQEWVCFRREELEEFTQNLKYFKKSRIIALEEFLARGHDVSTII